MKKDYLYVILFLSAMWMQYALIVATEWVKSGRITPPLPENSIFWPLTITLWVVVFTASHYLDTWSGGT